MNRPMSGRGRPEGGVHWVKALVLIVILVVIAVVVLNRTGSTSVHTAGGGVHRAGSSTTTSSLPAPTTTTTLLPASQVKVQVLNGVGTGSYAGLWSKKLQTQYGYITEPPDDATTKVPASVIYILTPGYQAEATALATTVGLSASAVDPTVPPPATAPIKATERATANLVLVIGQDLEGSA
jgi:hypothetical protein